MSCNRREFLSLSSLALASFAVASAVPTGALAQSLFRMDRLTPLRGGVGIYENRGGTIGWFVSPDGVAVVDTQFADTAGVFAEGLQSRTEGMINVLLNTHHHGDHVGGNVVLRPMADRIVSHAHAAELLRANEDFPTEGIPDTTFDSEWSIALGSETIRAKHYGRGAHTGGDATIHFEEANIVHMGDLMFNRTFPFVDGPSGASIKGWIEVLEEVARNHDDDTLYIFGHAAEGFPVTGSAADLMIQRDFLTAALEVAEQGIRENLTPEQLAEQGPPPGFPDHSGPANRLVFLYSVASADLTR